MNSRSWVSLFALVATTCCFSLQGNWTLASNPKIPAVGPPITLQITDYIFMNQTLLQKLSFRGCNQMLLQSQFTQNKVFINPSSYYVTPIPGLDCSTLKVNPLDAVFQGLANVFYFDIFVDVLNFKDPLGNVIFSFKRIVSTQNVDISGVWSMSQYGNTRTSLSVQISSSQITLCQGYSIYNYSFPSKNAIQLTKVKDTCPSQNLSDAINAVKYYRLFNGVLDLYDKNVVLVVQMAYSTAYDPNKPIFSPVAASTNSTSPSPPPPPSKTNQSINNSSSPSNLGVSASNLTGNWSIVSLFNIPFPKTPYYLLFSNSSIVLNGGCDTYTYQYTLNPATQLISLGNSTKTNKSCAGSDDQLFVSGITKMYKYLVSSNASAYSLIFFDPNGTPGYSLSLKIPPVSTPSTQKAAIDPFAPGQALMLLLQRRDLARAVAKISANSITFTLCNTITHTFKVDSPGKSKGGITISGGATTKNPNCGQSNDRIYITALNSAVSYSYDPNANTIVLSNKAGTQVVTFNRT